MFDKTRNAAYTHLQTSAMPVYAKVDAPVPDTMRMFCCCHHLDRFLE